MFAEIEAFIMQYFWLAIMLLALLIEGITVSLVSVWFALGALVAWLAQYCGLSWIYQVLVFFVISLLTLLLAFKCKPFRKQLCRQIRPTNYDALLNQEAVVIAEVSSETSPTVGQIKVKQQIWSAYLSEEVSQTESYPVGKKVKIVKISGVHAYVTSAE